MENILRTYGVLLDRAEWFWTGHEALMADGLVAFHRVMKSDTNPDITQALAVAYSYGAAVFLVSADETLLLMTYANSVVFHHNWKGTSPEFLRDKIKEPNNADSVQEVLRFPSHD